MSHTAGPWRWFGNLNNREIYLATVDRGRVFVLDFVRWGMRGAQPRFQGEHHFMVPASDYAVRDVEYRGDIARINHPDAHLIAAAPELLAVCKEALLFEHEYGFKAIAEKLLAVIAKAEGRL